MAKKNSHGVGHLHKRGNFYYYRYMINGKLKDVSLKVTTEADAKEKIKTEYLPLLNAKSKEQIALHVAESRKLINRVNTVKLEDTWEFYLNSPSRPDSSPGTLKGYKCAFNDFLSYIEKSFPSISNFSEINEEVAQGYAQYLWSERKISERTYNAYIKAMHLIYRVLVPRETNPFAKENVTRKTENQQGHNKFSEEQILSILSSFDNLDLYLMNKDEMRILFHLGALTGLRLADCCLLKWNEIFLSDGFIKRIPIKTNRIKKKAVIPLATKLIEQLESALVWKAREYVLPKIAERYLRNPDGIRVDTMRVFKFSGIETSEDKGKLQRQKNICRYGFHSFRHSFASIMASNGYNITMLAQVLADDTKTLEKYYINIDDKVIKETFNDLFIISSKQNVRSADREIFIDKIKRELDSKNIEQLSLILQYISTVH